MAPKVIRSPASRGAVAIRSPPTRVPLKVKSYEVEHQPNLTGTDAAYRPEGSLSKGGARPRATGDYQAWKPE